MTGQDKMNWAIIVVALLGIVFCLFKLAYSQDTEEITVTTTTMYAYDGWQHKTTLRSDTWDGSRQPQPNERLYIYKDGFRQNGYYQWNGYVWQPQNGAYTNRSDDE